MVKSGDRVGAYEIIAPLGAGGMGVLFRARDPRLNREIAIKFLADRYTENDERLQRFDREARAASALNHPHIITVYEIGEHEGRPFIAMELVEGKSLRAILSDGAPSMRRLLAIAAQIADGLAAAHERGIIHRDLKPENVMIAKNGYVKVLDFGLAKLEPEIVSQEEDTAKFELVTTPGLVMGTAAYMSPEQARGVSIDYRSDQFSLGTMLYEMLTGKRPFEGATQFDLLGAIVYHEPEKISNLNPRVPNAMEWIVERCLRKDPEERYDSTADLARELVLARDRMSDATPTPSDPVAPAPKALRVTGPFVAGIAIVALVAAAGAWLVTSWRSRLPRPAAAEKTDTIYLAVQSFRDASPEPLGPALGEGFAQTISARLGGTKSVRLMNALGVDVSSRKADDPRAICRETGANRLLRGSLQRSGNTLRVTWTIVDATGLQVAGDTVEGAYGDVFEIQDRLADQVLEQFGVERAQPVRPEQMQPFRQDRYLEAVGLLVRHDNEASVDGAIEILTSLGGSPTVLATLARAYLAKQVITDDPRHGALAMEMCDRALASGERSAEIYTTLGEVNVFLGKHEEAAAAFRAALSNEPDHARAMLGLARALADTGKVDAAEETYKKAIALRPNLWLSHNRLGVFYLVRGRYEPAIGAFNKALALTPDNIRVLNNLGASYQQLARYEDALRMYTLSLAERPNADGYSNRGTCLFFLGRYDESADSFERATALNPESAILWANLGDAYRWSSATKEKAGEAYAKAIELGERNLELRPRDGSLLSLIALSYAKSGDARRATSLARMAIENAAGDAYTLYSAAVALEVAGERERAVAATIAALDQGYSINELVRDPEMAKLREEQDVNARIVRANENKQGKG